MIREKWPVLLLGGALLVLSLACYGPTDNWRWDPSFYYAQLRSPIVDGNLDFRPETQPPNAIDIYTVTGLQPSPWPVGPGLFWAPFFVLAHLASLLINPAAADGFGNLYIALVSAGSALYGIIGLIVTYRLCCLYSERGLAVLAVALVLLASPLFFYVFRQPIMAHSVSFLAAASLLLLCVLLERGTLPLEQSGILLGVAVGVNALVRWSSVLMLVLPAGLLIWYGIDALRQHNMRRAQTVLAQMLLASLAGFIVISPQLVMWHQLYDTWLLMPTSGFRHTLPVNMPHVLFHTNRGLLFWAPFVLLGLGGIFRLPMMRLRILTMLYLGLLLVMLGRWDDWFSGGGYGPRYFIETLPLAALGFVVLLRDVVTTSMRWLALMLVAALLVLHQAALVLSVEQTWVGLSNYFAGQPLGVQFQGEALTRLLTSPAWLLTPRPHVGDERQAVLVSLLSGSLDSIASIPAWGVLVLISGTAGIGLLWGWLARTRGFRSLTDIAILIMGYLAGWFVFLMLLP
jgi:hypothetical protein